MEGPLEMLKYLETKQFMSSNQGAKESKAKEQLEHQPT